MKRSWTPAAESGCSETFTSPARGGLSLVTVLEEPAAVLGESAMLAEAALADWDRPEEEAAWAHVQLGK